MAASSREMTDYERLRLENIRRNQEMLAAFNIQPRLSDLSPAPKRPRVLNKSYKLSPERKPKFETPIVLRRSLRTRGKPPDAYTSGGLNDDFDESKSENKPGPQFSPAEVRKEPVPINMKDAFCGDNYGPNQRLIETIKSLSRKEQLDESADQELIFCEHEKRRPLCSIGIESLRLEPENMARVVPGRILNVKFIPTAGKRMVVAGNKFGHIGFWNADAKEDGDGIYLYQPHSSPVSGILIDSFSLSKMFTSCYDGFIRLMDINKEIFDSIYLSDYSIYALAQRPDNLNSLYYAEGGGYLGIWDLRAGKSSSSWRLHEDRINSIDFNMENNNTMATSSTDRTVSVWDMRNAGSTKPKPLRTINHERAVHSAYFSPSGRHLASTSFDNKIGLSSGANYEDVSMIYHNNQTGRWLSSFSYDRNRGIWGWDDSYIFIGSMKRGVDIISTQEKTIVKTLQSELVSAIQCRFDTHPYDIGMLAGATSGGQVYLWGTS